MPHRLQKISIPDGYSCSCEQYARVLEQQGKMRYHDAHALLTVICGSCLCLIIMMFVLFLMGAAWFEKRADINTLVVATILGSFSAMIGVLFAGSRKNELKKSIRENLKDLLTEGDDDDD